MPNDETQTCKLVLLGNGSVGKTSIIARFVQDGFSKVYKQTVGCDFVEKRMDIRGKPVAISVWDIGGQSLSSDNLPNYVSGSDAIFLCYDTTDLKSFRDLDDWEEKVNAIYMELDVKGRAEFQAEYAGKKTRKKYKHTKRVDFYIVGNKGEIKDSETS